MATNALKTELYPTGSRLLDAMQFPNMRVEHWCLEPGRFQATIFENNVIAFVTEGRTLMTRLANGRMQSTSIQRGSVCIYPADMHESGAEITDSIHALYVHLPRCLVGHRALEDYEVDASQAELVNVDGLADPLLYQLGIAILGVMNQAAHVWSRLFIDGVQSALAGHLLSNYTRTRWRPPTKAPELDSSRLRRVLKLIEERFAEPLSLSELAAQACLSEFHFSRLFRSATGLTPYRYVTRRRVQAAEELLMQSQESLLGVTLQVGFGSQASFIRAFRQFTGVTPSLYRAQQKEVKVRQL